MIRRTKEYILENKMIKNHSTVLVALSGGADSVCLLLVLNEIKRQCADELDFALEAVHVEHGIRGAESREDARFASDLCERLNIPCHVHSVDVPQYAASHGLGLEEAARILRYEAFERKSPGYCAMRRLKRRQADILAKLPMQQTKNGVTAGRWSLRLRTIWRTTQRQFFFRCFAEAERRDSPACIRFL